ncbi:MAG: hypothetical protein J5863_07370, partial [Desulfovibrio sp.]|nr:hypothetical protein [Desulfovibrio sp.]
MASRKRGVPERQGRLFPAGWQEAELSVGSEAKVSEAPVTENPVAQEEKSPQTADDLSDVLSD